MQDHDTTLGSSLMFIIINQGRAEKVIDYLLQLGIRGATAFKARGTATNPLLKALAIADVRKEVILVTLPAIHEQEVVRKLVEHFHFDRPDMGVVFTVGVTRVLGSRHFPKQPISAPQAGGRSNLQAILAIVNKGQAEDVLEQIEAHGLPRGVVIDAHGTADPSRPLMNLMIEPEKDIVLTVAAREQIRPLVRMLTECLELDSPNSGVLVVLNLNRAAGVTLSHQIGLEDEEPESVDTQISGCAAILTIVDNDREWAVVTSAETAGSRGGTYIHARGTIAYHSKQFVSHGIEKEREAVLIIVPERITETVSDRISTDLTLDQPGNGILMVLPLYETVGIARCD